MKGKGIPALIPVVFVMDWWKLMLGFAIGAGFMGIMEAVK